jgi:hypothetical protein
MPSDKTGLRKVKAATSLGAAYITQCNLLWRCNANRDQRRVGRTGIRAAGSSTFTEYLRRVSGRPAIGRDQNLVILALHGAAGRAVRLHHPDARTGRPRRTLRARWAGRTGWAGRPHRADIALWPLGARGTGVTLRPFATTGQTHNDPRQQYARECQMRCTHFQVLPKSLEKDCRLHAPVTEDQTAHFHARMMP